MTFITTFNPGPSQISVETKADIQFALDQKLLEISHRSPVFSEISKTCITELKKLLGVPEDYQVFYLDSASQAWHSILANTVSQDSFHLVNGAFSKKFYEAAMALGKQAQLVEVDWSEQIDFADLDIPEAAELVTVCANETSTGVGLQNEDLEVLRTKTKKALLAVDLTSCAAVVDYDMNQADLWYFSVQKCFGLPAGLGILIVSPEAYKRSEMLVNSGKNQAGIWQWSKLKKPMVEKNYQTPQTPNVLNIYLLGQQCKRWNERGGIKIMESQAQEKMDRLEAWVEADKTLDFFVGKRKDRSQSVLAVKAAPERIQQLHEQTKAAGIVLGKGYGKTKLEVFRVANFPALSTKEVDQLIEICS